MLELSTSVINLEFSYANPMGSSSYLRIKRPLISPQTPILWPFQLTILNHSSLSTVSLLKEALIMIPLEGEIEYTVSIDLLFNMQLVNITEY